MTNYNLTPEQRAEVEQKLQDLLELCQIYRVPMFATCAIMNDETRTEYSSIVYSAQSHALQLHNDRIRKHMLIASDSFEVVPKREVVTFDPFGIVK